MSSRLLTAYLRPVLSCASKSPSTSHFPSPRFFHASGWAFGPIQDAITEKLNQQLQSEEVTSNSSSSRRRHHSTYNPRGLSTGRRRKVAILGGGSWGTAVADLISYNVIKYPEYFDSEVLLYLRDPSLVASIETVRENVKYLPTIRLQSNLRPLVSLEETLSLADILIFAVPHEYVAEMCYRINDTGLATRQPIGLSLIKGLHFDANGNLERISEVIRRMIGIQVGVLSGANVALEVAKRQYCEATLCSPEERLETMLLALFTTSYFKVTTSTDQETVELCAALKNVIACGAGLVDGLGYGINTKAAAIACGWRELVAFIRATNPTFCMETLFSSAGIADTIASSFGGRNRKVGEAFVRDSSDLGLLEQRLLKGQKLQGPNTAKSVYRLLEREKRLATFPFFTAIHRIFNEGDDPKTLLEAIRVHY